MQRGSTAKRVLVTGGSGFLGSRIVRQARETGMQVSAPGHREMDITTPGALAEHLVDVKTVIHAAGLAHVFGIVAGSESDLMVTNADGTANVVRASVEAEVDHLVLVSSVSVYGPRDTSVIDEQMSCRPVGNYARSKYLAERRATEITEGTSTSLTILRMATIYGEGDPGNVARLMRLIDRRRFLWIGNGRNRKSLIYVSDAARACVLAADLESEAAGVFNVSAPPCTMRDIVGTLASLLRRFVPRFWIPAELARRGARVLYTGGGRLSALPGTVETWLVDSVYAGDRAEAALGFRAEVSLAEGLHREVTWYKE